MKHAFAAVAAITLFSATTAAADCADITVEDAFDLEEDAVVALYACLGDKMAEGYAKGDNEVAAVFRTWAPTATRPAVAGPHGNRLLQTFANDVAAEQYLKFDYGDFAMPAGSVLAKESITVSIKKKKARPGPLFIMTKLEAGGAPDTADWLYSAVQPNGKPMKIKQSFCHDCHAGYADSDYLGYPVEEVRLGQ